MPLTGSAPDLTYTPSDPDWSTDPTAFTYSVSVTGELGSDLATQVVTITVTANVNDSPMISGGS